MTQTVSVEEQSLQSPKDNRYTSTEVIIWRLGVCQSAMWLILYLTICKGCSYCSLTAIKSVWNANTGCNGNVSVPPVFQLMSFLQMKCNLVVKVCSMRTVDMCDIMTTLIVMLQQQGF
ncbi:hypothetical protein TNCV_4755891 [Trichonephila clavipes]|nr:hypothetical protein TNCV_4755891 [Trichonephila clavipes]